MGAIGSINLGTISRRLKKENPDSPRPADFNERQQGSFMKTIPESGRSRTRGLSAHTDYDSIHQMTWVTCDPGPRSDLAKSLAASQPANVGQARVLNAIQDTERRQSDFNAYSPTPRPALLKSPAPFPSDDVRYNKHMDTPNDSEDLFESPFQSPLTITKINAEVADTSLSQPVAGNTIQAPNVLSELSSDQSIQLAGTDALPIIDNQVVILEQTERMGPSERPGQLETRFQSSPVGGEEAERRKMDAAFAKAGAILAMQPSTKSVQATHQNTPNFGPRPGETRDGSFGPTQHNAKQRSFREHLILSMDDNQGLIPPGPSSVNQKPIPPNPTDSAANATDATDSSDAAVVAKNVTYFHEESDNDSPRYVGNAGPPASLIPQVDIATFSNGEETKQSSNSEAQITGTGDENKSRESSIVQTETISIGSGKETKRSWISRLRPESTQKSHALAPAPAFISDAAIEKAAKEILKPYNVKKKTAFSWIQMLLLCVPEMLERNEGAAGAARAKIASQAEEIRSLVSRWQDVETHRKKAYDAWQSSRNELRAAMYDLNRCRADVQALDHQYRTLQGKLNNTEDSLEKEARRADQIQQNYDKLCHDISSTRGKLTTAGKNNAQLRADNQHLEHKSKEQELVIKKLQAGLEDNDRKWQVYVQEEMAKIVTANQLEEDRLKTQITALKGEHASEVSRINKDFTAEAAQLQRKIANQKHQIASYTTGRYNPISDSDFRVSIQTLSQQVNNLVEFVPRQETPFRDQSLDPTHFLRRNAQQGSRIHPRFVKSLCWSIIIRGLFQHSLGFGALGSQGEGYDALFELYRLFAKPDSGEHANSALSFPNEKELNVWRATLFDAILRDVKESTITGQETKFSILFRSNINNLVKELVDALQHVSGENLDPRASTRISSLVYDLGLLALKMGTQRAQLFLESSVHGTWVKSDEKFSDEGESVGEEVQVDIVTQPCLRRVGDGREDLLVQKIVAKGSFVSLK